MRTVRCSVAVVPMVALAGSAFGVCDAWCLVENPSFDLPDAGAEPAEGWCSFGNVGVTAALAEHGPVSATASGPFTGGWAVSGYWQRFEAAPGDRFAVVAHAAHLAADPITGAARGILNVEWRDAAETLISFESFDLVDSSSPTDCMVRFEFQTAAAPAGTATARLLAGFLQSPAQETGTALIDLVDVHRTDPRGWDDLQWVDFGPTTLSFAGYTWRVKGPGVHGPGPNNFSDSAANAWVDGDGMLHLRITHVGGTWHVPEIVPEQAFGYGTYRFELEADLDDLDPNVVLGMFLWEYQPCWVPDSWWNASNELDIEFSRWGVPDDDPAQYVAQPYTRAGNRHRFPLVTGPAAPTTHTFEWAPREVTCRSWHGHAAVPDAGDLIETWIYAGPDIPRPEAPRVHVNLWLLGGAAPTDGQEVEVVLSGFTFTPLCLADLDGDGAVSVTDLLQLLAAWGTGDVDLDGDCTTAVTDLLVMLMVWGPC